MLTETQRRCTGIPITFDRDTHEPAAPVGMFVVVPLECPLCRLLTTRWWGVAGCADARRAAVAGLAVAQPFDDDPAEHPRRADLRADEPAVLDHLVDCLPADAQDRRRLGERDEVGDVPVAGHEHTVHDA